jgi:hypothetical protein
VDNGQPVDSDLPFYWTEAGGMVALNGWFSGVATDISQNKLAIVGFGSPFKGAPGEPFRWTPASGIKSIRSLLAEEGLGVPAASWALGFQGQQDYYGESLLYSISANGRIIVGSGKNPSGKIEAYLVELPVPGDFVADGFADGADVLVWQRGVGSIYDSDGIDDWRANYAFALSITPPSAPPLATVPEPTSLIAASIMLVCRLAIRKTARESRQG